MSETALRYYRRNSRFPCFFYFSILLSFLVFSAIFENFLPLLWIIDYSSLDWGIEISRSTNISSRRTMIVFSACIILKSVLHWTDFFKTSLKWIMYNQSRNKWINSAWKSRFFWLYLKQFYIDIFYHQINKWKRTWIWWICSKRYVLRFLLIFLEIYWASECLWVSRSWHELRTLLSQAVFILFDSLSNQSHLFVFFSNLSHDHGFLRPVYSFFLAWLCYNGPHYFVLVAFAEKNRRFFLMGHGFRKQDKKFSALSETGSLLLGNRALLEGSGLGKIWANEAVWNNEPQ